ncbi:RES family NAD+ phosphorylase [Escherichia coli]|nr:RES family NAD+ phosphorylase [Escherichia coli]
MHICINHVLEPNLKKYILHNNTQEKCVLCRKKSLGFDAESPDVHNLLKSIIRYNYDEVSYNSHFGGDDVTSLLLAGGFIFSSDIVLNNDKYSDLEGVLWNMKVYDDDGISIYAGYNDRCYNMPLIALKNSKYQLIESLQDELLVKNYYLFEKEIRGLLASYGNSFTTIINDGVIAYRARVGVAGYRLAYEDWNRHGKKIYQPYTGDMISAVPPLKATGGRANRPGVSYLYCATDKYTAVSEVRPHPTDVVSLGQFKTVRTLKLFDFSHPNFLPFYQSEDALHSMIPYAKMANVFNSASPPSLEGRYSVSQLISECIRQEGYDGIQFLSTVGEGMNLVIFNPADLLYIEGSSEVLEIEQVSYKYKGKQIIGVNDDYEIYYGDLE